jgi:hypothetical protein
MVKRSLYILSLFFAFIIGHQANASAYFVTDSSLLLKQYEDTLNELQHEKIKEHTNDTYKQKANALFLNLLRKALSVSGSINYPFDSLTTISRLTAPDKSFRILNWNISKDDGTYGYYGFIQSYDPKKKTYVLYELRDRAASITNPQSAVYSPDNWLGMLYYKIIPDPNEKNTFILLAWQGYNNIITRKVIDVITFNSEGVPSFGKVIFKNLPPGMRGVAKRIIFQYSANVSMSLEYNDNRKMILFDHLAPPDPSLAGQYQYYGPSFQIDAFSFKDNEWQFMTDVDARNAASPNDKYYHPESEDFKKNKKPLYNPH